VFDNVFGRLVGQPINSLDDVRNAFVQLTHTFQCCELVHQGTLRISNTASDAANAGGSTLILEQHNNGKNRASSPFASPAASVAEAASRPLALNIRQGDAYMAGNVYFGGNAMFAAAPQVVFVGTAAAKWAAGTPPTVVVSHPTLGSLTVRLANTATQDPNIRSGDTVVFARADNGLYYALDSQLDSKIGTIKMWIRTDPPPAGWRRISQAGRFIKISAADGSDTNTTGGSATHTHSISGNTDSGGGSGTTDAATGNTDSAVTGLTAVDPSSGFVTTSTGSFGAGGTSAVTGITSDSHIHTITEGGHSHGLGSHVHGLSGLSHSHSISLTSGANSADPLHYVLCLIERYE